VTETRNVIPSVEFKTCMTINFKVFTVLSRFEFENYSSILKYFMTVFMQGLPFKHVL